MALACAHNQMLAALDKGGPFVRDLGDLLAARTQQAVQLGKDVQDLETRLQGKERALQLLMPSPTPTPDSSGLFDQPTVSDLSVEASATLQNDTGAAHHGDSKS